MNRPNRIIRTKNLEKTSQADHNLDHEILAFYPVILFHERYTRREK